MLKLQCTTRTVTVRLQCLSPFQFFSFDFVISIRISFIMIFRFHKTLRLTETQHKIMKLKCDVESQAESKQCVSVQQQSTYKRTSQFCASCVSWYASHGKQNKKKTNKHAQQLLSQFFTTGPHKPNREHFFKQLPSSACTLRLLLGLYCCL